MPLPQELRALEDGDKAAGLENFVDRELRSFLKRGTSLRHCSMTSVCGTQELINSSHCAVGMSGEEQNISGKSE